MKTIEEKYSWPTALEKVVLTGRLPVSVATLFECWRESRWRTRKRPNHFGDGHGWFNSSLNCRPRRWSWQNVTLCLRILEADVVVDPGSVRF